MESAKETQKYKFENYTLEVALFSPQKIMLTITDQISRNEYHQKMIQLTQVNGQTLIMGIQNTNQSVQLKIAPKDTKQEILEVTITVSPKFLKPVCETILLKKSRTIPQEQFCLKQIQILSKKVKDLKENKEQINIISSTALQEKSYNGASLQPMLTLKLKKGTYMITVSFFTKASGTWIYLYLGNLPTFNTHGGWYFPSGSNYFPVVVRTIYTVNSDTQDVKVNTNCAQSYPITVKNMIGTAKKIK